MTASGSISSGSSVPSKIWKTAGGFSTDWSNVQIEIIPLGKHLYFLQGSGANMCVSTGPDGVLLVDCEFQPMSAKIKEAIARLQPGPIRFLINTHGHADHTGGNADFGETGTVIIAQEKVRSRMISSGAGAKPPPIPQAGWPMITFDESMVLHCNGEDVLLFYDGPAHTDNDIVVFFPKSNVVEMGDIYINGLYPIIDAALDGTIQGYFPIIDRVLGMIDDETKVVPGHGPVGTKKELQAYRDMLAVIRDRVQEMLCGGKTLEDIIASDPSREFNAEWASDRVGPHDVTRMIYEGLVGR